jgi:ABC-type glutathione transport system ATPase component
MSEQPQPTTTPAAAAESYMLQLKDLKMFFPITKGLFGGVKGYVKAADEINFAIRKSETLGLVGESGCGKTTVGRCVVRAYQVTSGEILFQNTDGSQVAYQGCIGVSFTYAAVPQWRIWNAYLSPVAFTTTPTAVQVTAALNAACY